METDESANPVSPVEPELKLEQVRAVLAKNSRSGFTAQIGALLQKYGADKLSQINPATTKLYLLRQRCYQMANKHALLSASFSERWLNCPLSARLCKSYEDKGSNYGAEGPEAHRLCEFRLKQTLWLPAENPIEHFSWYNGEMDECVTHVSGSKLPANFNTIISEWKVSANKYRAPGGRAFCRPIRVSERTEIFENSLD